MNLVVAASFIPQEKPQRNHKQAFGPTQQGPGLFNKSKARSGGGGGGATVHNQGQSRDTSSLNSPLWILTEQINCKKHILGNTKAC